MVADILTKPLPGWKVKAHTAVLRLRSACGGVQKCAMSLLTMLEQAGDPVDKSCVASTTNDQIFGTRSLHHYDTTSD